EAKNADGGPVLLDLTLRAVRDDAGGVLVHVEGGDITDARRAERALRISAAKFAGIVSIASYAITSVDSTYRIIHYNRGAENIFGYTSEEAVGQRLDILLPEQFRSTHTAQMARFGAGPDRARRMGERGEITGRRKSGEIFPAEAS